MVASVGGLDIHAGGFRTKVAVKNISGACACGSVYRQYLVIVIACLVAVFATIACIVMEKSCVVEVKHIFRCYLGASLCEMGSIERISEPI